MDLKFLFEKAIESGKRHLPEILTGFGVTGLFAAGVAGSVISVKVVAPKLNEFKEDLHEIEINEKIDINDIESRTEGNISLEETESEPEIVDAELANSMEEIDEIEEETEIVYSVEQANAKIEECQKHYRKQRFKIYRSIGLLFIKAYGAPLGVAVVSIVSIFKGQGIHINEKMALKAEVASLALHAEGVRERLVDTVGEEKANEIFFNEKETARVITLDEEGNIVSEEKNKAPQEEKKADTSQLEESQWTYIFDQTNSRWTRDRDTNVTFVKGIESYINNLLMSRGHIVANEVLDLLGYPRLKEGFKEGCVRKKGETGNGHFYIGVKEGVDAALIITLHFDGDITDAVDWGNPDSVRYY